MLKGITFRGHWHVKGGRTARLNFTTAIFGWCQSQSWMKEGGRRCSCLCYDKASLKRNYSCLIDYGSSNWTADKEMNHRNSGSNFRIADRRKHSLYSRDDLLSIVLPYFVKVCILKVQLDQEFTYILWPATIECLSNTFSQMSWMLNGATCSSHSNRSICLWCICVVCMGGDPGGRGDKTPHL